ncbi:MAG: hypothetical protein ACUVUU_02695 [bacterium]
MVTLKSKARKSKHKKGRRRMGPPKRKPRGHCVCPTCGIRIPFYTEAPCYVMTCPRCGIALVKETTRKLPVDEEAQPTSI